VNRGFVLAAMIAVVAAALSTGFSDQKTPKVEEPMQLQADQSGRSCVWMKYSHRDRPLQYWIGIWETGEAWYLRFDNSNRIERDGIAYSRILESKSGKLPCGEVEVLLEFIDRKGFFDMETGWGDADPILSEDDIVTINVCKGEKVYSVHARPPSHISEALMEIVNVIRGKTPDLQEDGRGGVFLEAERLDETRANRLRETYQFLSLSEDEIDQHAHLERILSNPGEFVHAGSWKDAGIERYIGSNSFFFVSALGGEFEVGVFLRETTKR
jgi:hypothetical protein